MRFQVERDVLADAVAWTARTLPGRAAVPILNGMLIEADPATSTRHPVELRLRGRRAAVLRRRSSRPAAGPWSPVGCWPRSAERCRRRPSTSAMDGAKVIVRCGGSRFTLQTMPVDDYPTLPDDATAGRHDRQRPVRRRGRAGHDRRGPRRLGADPVRRTGADRRRPAAPGVHRPLPDRGPRPAVAADPRRTWPRSPWCRPAPWRRWPGTGTAAPKSGSAWARDGADTMIGFECGGRTA